MRIAPIAAIFVAASSAATAQESRDPLATRPGFELGAQLSDYEYTEPGVIRLSGNRLSGIAALTFAGESPVFGKIDLRTSFGRLLYEGSGTKNNVPDLILETRAVAGFDLVGPSASLSPYAGLGYRYLFNDLRGQSSTGAAGYRRYSNYLYAPVGATARLRLREGWVLAPTLEADFFLQGKQITDLSDTGIAGLQDVTNTQHSGHGYRGSLMFEREHWAFGAWLQYWHIAKSDVQSAGAFTGFEPENKTTEWGLEARYRF